MVGVLLSCSNRCVIPCKADSECPSQLICVCDNENRSLAPRHILGFKSSPGVESCFPLLEGMEGYDCGVWG